MNYLKWYHIPFTLYVLGTLIWIMRNHQRALSSGVRGLDLHYREQPSNSAENGFNDDADVEETS